MVEREDLKKVKEELEEFYARVKEIYPVKKVILYGSYAKGTQRRDSDIDVGVIVDLPEGADKIAVNARLFRCAREIDVNIEPFCILWHDYLNHEPASILGEIVRTGIEVG